MVMEAGRGGKDGGRSMKAVAGRWGNGSPWKRCLDIYIAETAFEEEEIQSPTGLGFVGAGFSLLRRDD